MYSVTNAIPHADSINTGFPLSLDTVMPRESLKLVCASDAKISLRYAYNTLTAELEYGNSSTALSVPRFT